MSATAVFGSTGLVGSQILSTLLSTPKNTTTIQTISRRAPSSSGAKLQATIEPDTSLWASKLAALSPAPSTVFSALGTTRQAAGGIANQWKIDHDLNVELAKAAKRQVGTRTFVFISSAGSSGVIANRLPYTQMKQGVEKAIEDLGFEQSIILRPGLILGDREVPHQGGPLLIGVVRALGRWIGQGAQDRWGQEADVIARAAVHAARIAEEGKAPAKHWVLECADIVRLGRNEPTIIGPATGPEPPYPYRMEGKVISGFGRGSKELGIPTANLPVDESVSWISDIPSGVYFGWASLALPSSHPDFLGHQFELYPMVMSIGYNPFYKNTVRSAEVHVLQKFKADFYGCQMRLLITGFIREEKDYNGLEALIADIEFDCEVARRSLQRVGWAPNEKVEGGKLDYGWLLRRLDEEEEQEGEKKA
ncbi:hypothetical protein B0H66DRAFT_479370 [Apodospora peruviana]|uniref:Riboflavin kinase n=1 Tax=Apodospora peruviana TaxID=516989 RepID=A0AAE0M1Y9_9PEZI|nr:hypothetical protein B0H66DRAFT_479370 [Apodospora peruviana]